MYLSMLITQGIVPICLLLWQGLGRSHSRLGWLLKTLLVAAYLAAVSLVGMWPVLLSWWMPYLYWTIWFLLAALTYSRHKNLVLWPKRTFWGILKVFICGGLVGFLTVYSLQAAKGYALPDEQPVSLAFPLRGGDYSVFNGGSQALLNSHVLTLNNPESRSYRGQGYGIDIVKLNRFGSRAAGLVPKDIEKYEIFGETVYAPCSGTVISLRRDRPNMIPPQPDRTYIPGNHVLLRCREADVLLAHFSPGSITLNAGDSVTTGQPLGTVGNSGNSNEPHLHIHAQRPGSETDPLNADPLPVLFDSALGGNSNQRYLVRNARISKQSKFIRSLYGQHIETTLSPRIFS
ncbi:M23 peptidase domain protein [Synechococcus sp. PCC 7335]|uniref:M23 family metallopeptidase n=1 Tax=Synechococcus sp. (strain ATCC 29403 / PCC 7335) TaxID=91464 RepID=UPI00017ED654|nr:M23 family metallopeptidase [Synechococcus sp. PCC 7335]EDX83592.1 M23 peptidase domain protein [Synechococcus sp. PCC 7335]